MEDRTTAAFWTAPLARRFFSFEQLTGNTI
jgi:hypothetical protein